MRACYVLLAAATALLTTSDVVSAMSVSKAMPQGWLSSTGITAQTSGFANRFLRIRESEDDGYDNTENEERGMLNLVYEGGVNFFKKMTQSAPALNKVDDQAAALVKFEDKWLAGQVDKFSDKYLTMFKQIHELGYTPRQVSRMSGLAKKTLSMNKHQLLHDGDYMFWLYYSRWWAENVAKKAA
ncbi:putative secreted RxLR effector protein [Phytophthora cinnamomi]|uniref:putative secreted RxLR effector protein n=1 Tax=Phytophthora cinnamomi TaxID=4785 RepID=UPI002A2A8A10|nr:putative secreted RxLR effector protein [Phytophthora cinnamomi]KAG6572509.1 putative secreted RxLR effector protein [Phytophthora cinnamomi]KAJ8524566.1 hypothetical protein ON010_g16551 [Phytophthora cinnamomi]